MYFVGVTTARSSVMDLFPKWADILGIDASLVGLDISLDAPREEYRRIVQGIKEDPMSRGALVTTHKINVLEAARDLFDHLDPYARLFHEISCIAKNESGLCGSAKDPISSGLAMETFVPQRFWQRHGGQVLLMGAGGSSRAILASLLDPKQIENWPTAIHVTDTVPSRITEMHTIFSDHPLYDRLQMHKISDCDQHGQIMAGLPPYSLVTNATGLGKDRPGSPLPDNAVFPAHSLVWELNYRGTLEFLRQAQDQQLDKDLTVVDGWEYFIHGWTQVIAEVFAIDDLARHLPRIMQVSAASRR